MAEVWKVGIVLPNASFSELYKRLASFWLTTGTDRIPLPRDLVEHGLTLLQRYGLKGVPVGGTLTMTARTIELETKPTWVEKLSIEGELSARFTIPIRELQSVSGPESLALGLLTGTLGLRRITLETPGGPLHVTAGLNGPSLTKRLKALRS